MEELEKVENNAENVTTEQEQSTTNSKKETKKKFKIKKILDWVLGGVFVAIIAVAAVFVIGSRTGDGYVLGQYQFPIVLTDSMVPAYPVNSGLVVKKVKPEQIHIGDDVMFKWVIHVDGQDMQTNMTHRIFDIKENTPGAGNKYYFYAHGINTHSEYCKIVDSTEPGGWKYGDCTDTSDPNNVQIFSEDAIVGKVVAKSVPLGYMMTFIQSPIGLIVLIMVPAFYIMITSVIDIFKKLPDDDEEVATAGASSGSSTTKLPEPKPGEDPLAGLSEEEIERLKKELYKELLGKGGKKK